MSRWHEFYFGALATAVPLWADSIYYVAKQQQIRDQQICPWRRTDSDWSTVLTFIVAIIFMRTGKLGEPLISYFGGDFELPHLYLVDDECMALSNLSFLVSSNLVLARLCILLQGFN